jgi:alkaline phosphatase
MNNPFKHFFALSLLTLLQPVALAENASTWLTEGEAALQANKAQLPNTNRAKNIILFIGDGMGVSTVTAARIFEGQQNGEDGERNQLSFEQFPYVALSKTYSANQQTADSAPTMTAIVSGVKTNSGIISLNQSVHSKETDNNKIQANKVTTILEQAEMHGLATGIISTARITHATPAATYAHTSNRNWETDAHLPKSALKSGVKDIASQLIDNFGEHGIGDGIEVVLGGGRTNFLPNNRIDTEYPSKKGKRQDGRNLIKEYQIKFKAKYITNLTEFEAIKPKNTSRLLGLFEPSHMQYEYDRNNAQKNEPSLAEMTRKSIDILAKNNKGYFLMVEAARIDHASHAGNAYRTLSETVALSNAVKAALAKVNTEETLIIVTADHSHTLTIGGYPKRGNPILGNVVSPDNTAPTLAKDGKPYTTISFANGKGYHHHNIDAEAAHAGRSKALKPTDTQDPDFHQEANVPLESETHGGEDVAIYAIGPQAYLMRGVQEQTYIYQVMKEAFGF